MATQKFSKFIRPEAGRPGQITDRDLDILEAVLRYRFCSAAHIVRLAGGNEDSSIAGPSPVSARTANFIITWTAANLLTCLRSAAG